MKTEETRLLEDAIKKLGLNSLDGFTPRKELLALIKYAIKQGYTEGWDIGYTDGISDTEDRFT